MVLDKGTKKFIREKTASSITCAGKTEYIYMKKNETTQPISHHIQKSPQTGLKT